MRLRFSIWLYYSIHDRHFIPIFGYIFKTAEARHLKFSSISYNHTILIHTKFQIDCFKNDGVMLNVFKRL